MDPDVKVNVSVRMEPPVTMWAGPAPALRAGLASYVTSPAPVASMGWTAPTAASVVSLYVCSQVELF